MKNYFQIEGFIKDYGTFRQEILIELVVKNQAVFFKSLKFKKIIGINDIAKYINQLYKLNLYRNDK